MNQSGANKIKTIDLTNIKFNSDELYLLKFKTKDGSIVKARVLSNIDGEVSSDNRTICDNKGVPIMSYTQNESCRIQVVFDVIPINGKLFQYNKKVVDK